MLTWDAVCPKKKEQQHPFYSSILVDTNESIAIEPCSSMKHES